MPERRLEAEAIRDALLVVSGTLQATPPVGSPIGALEGTIRREEIADLVTRERPIRSVYLPSLRGHVVDALDVFDAPDAAFVTGDREETSVATQALFMMNDADVLRYSDAFAARLLALQGDDDARITAGFELAFGRKPVAMEVNAVRAFLADYARTIEPAPSGRASGMTPSADSGPGNVRATGQARTRIARVRSARVRIARARAAEARRRRSRL